MPIQGLIIAYRKSGLTPAEFQAHYENSHVPILQRLAGDDFFLSHQRFYLSRGGGVPAPAMVVLGEDQDFDYDALTIVTFKDKEHMDRFNAKTNSKEAREEIEADEEKFVDRSKVKIVIFGDVKETVNQV